MSHSGAGLGCGFSRATPPVSRNLHTLSSTLFLKGFYKIKLFLQSKILNAKDVNGSDLHGFTFSSFDPKQLFSRGAKKITKLITIRNRISVNVFFDRKSALHSYFPFKMPMVRVKENKSLSFSNRDRHTFL